MMSPFDSGPELVPAEDRTAAIATLLPAGSIYGSPQRFQAYAHEHDIPLEWMWMTRTREGAPRACVLAIPSPGRTVMMFTSRAQRISSVAELARVIRHSSEFLADQAVDLAQGLLLPADTLTIDAFHRADYSDLATLQYMEASVSRYQNSPVLPEDITLMTYQADALPQLIEILDASYEGTKDCPGLRGLRTTRDVIIGHQSAGRYEPKRWTLMLRNNQPIGAILINQSSSGPQAELVYLGLAASVRGRGLGRLLLEQGLYVAARANLHTLSLAVDTANTPAAALYASSGFRVTGQRRAVIRSLRSPQDSRPGGGCPPETENGVEKSCG